MRRILAAAALASLTAGVATAAAPAGLGLTAQQLEEADVVDAAGHDIGDVEHVVLNPQGRATALIVSLDRPDPQPDKLVRIGMAGLRAMPEKDDPGDYNIVTATPLAKLMAMPAWQPR